MHVARATGSALPTVLLVDVYRWGDKHNGKHLEIENLGLDEWTLNDGPSGFLNRIVPPSWVKKGLVCPGRIASLCTFPAGIWVSTTEMLSITNDAPVERPLLMSPSRPYAFLTFFAHPQPTQGTWLCAPLALFHCICADLVLNVLLPCDTDLNSLALTMDTVPDSGGKIEFTEYCAHSRGFSQGRLTFFANGGPVTIKVNHPTQVWGGQAGIVLFGAVPPVTDPVWTLMTPNSFATRNPAASRDDGHTMDNFGAAWMSGLTTTAPTVQYPSIVIVPGQARFTVTLNPAAGTSTACDND